MQIVAVVLGADDPEMRAIEAVCLAADVRVEYAERAGRRVSPGEAYMADAPLAGPGVLWVECDREGGSSSLRADHHRPGDPGFGLAPSEFWRASSLGQVCAAVWPQLRERKRGTVELPEAFPEDDPRAAVECVSVVVESLTPWALTYIAAADHCLAAALQGQCPGVDPDALLDWRLTAPGSPHTSEPDGLGGRRTVPPEVVRERALLARYMLAPGYNLDACRLVEGVGLVTIGETTAVDLRAFGSATLGLPLADVACGLGVAYVLRVREGYPGPGKLHSFEQPQKVVLGGCGEGSAPGIVPMDAWESWCRGQGYTGEVYGDPVRGYAGCYIEP